MPASMISAEVGSSSPRMGSSSATVMAGPIPGSTPTAVPMITPMRASSRLTGVAAVANPCSSSSRLSITRSLGGCRPAAQHYRRAVEQQATTDHPAEEVDQQNVGDEDSDQQQHRLVIGPAVQVDILTSLCLTAAA